MTTGQIVTDWLYQIHRLVEDGMNFLQLLSIVFGALLLFINVNLMNINSTLKRNNELYEWDLNRGCDCGCDDEEEEKEES